MRSADAIHEGIYLPVSANHNFSMSLFVRKTIVAGSIFILPAMVIDLHAAIHLEIGNNFTGASLFTDAFTVPPDSNGAIGPAHFVEFVNGRFSVYAKTNGAKVQTMTDTVFWQNAGVNLDGLELSDPRIIYDPLSGRWFASQIDLNRTNLVANRFLLGISATADPTGVWQAVAWPADPGGTFADFPRLGVDANGVYLTGNQFDGSGNFAGVIITSLPKVDLLLTTPTAANRTTSGLITYGNHGFSLEPVLNFNPVAGNEPVLAAESDGTDFQYHTILKFFAVSNSATANAVFDAVSNVVVPPYFVPLNPPQPDGLVTLDDGDLRIGSYAVQVGDDIYAVHGVELNPGFADGRAALRWYRIGASDRQLRESGTISDTNLDLFYPSLAVNTKGFIVIGFNGCSTNTFVSSYAVAGRTINGQTVFGDRVLLKAGAGNYELSVGGDNRWGDYSTTTVDADNPGHFWTIQEFPSAANVWSTAITEMIVTEIPPALGLNLTNGLFQLTWPTNEIGYALQAATNLNAGATWSGVSNAVTVINQQFTVTVTNKFASQFFRLAR